MSVYVLETHIFVNYGMRGILMKDREVFTKHVNFLMVQNNI